MAQGLAHENTQGSHKPQKLEWAITENEKGVLGLGLRPSKSRGT